VKPSLKNQRGGFALGFVVGLLFGLAVALAVALYVTNAKVPLLSKGQQRTPEQDAAEAERNKTWDPNAALAGKPPVRSVAPAAPSVPAPASDTAIVPRTPGPVLPPPPEAARPSAAARNVETPKSTRDAAAILNGSDPGEAKTAAAGADPFIYFVQVGAYSKSEDAEQQRARLALAGLRATVTEREQNGRTVHRVRLGPFEKRDEAEAQTDRAKAIDPDAALVRVDRSKQ
jgi:cell division protein FtsN